MNQDTFIEQKKSSWENLDELLKRAKNGEGIRKFTTDEIQQLGTLYRRVCSDLSYSRSRKYDTDLIKYLNQMARKAYGVIYLTDQSKKGVLIRFFTRDFPQLFRENLGYIMFAVLIFFLFSGIGFLMDRVDERYTYMVVPQEFLDIWDKAETERSSFEASQFPIMSSWYWTHNFRVGLVAYLLGITLGMGTFYMVAYNGIILGAISSLVLRSEYHIRFFSFILSHAFVELLAIFICGGAGFMIARALLAPGDLPVKDALNLYGKKSVLLVLGTIPMFLIAGIIEASFSRFSLPLSVKASFGFLTAGAMFVYFAYSGKQTEKK